MRQLLVESLLLAGLGAAGGWLFAYWSLRLIVASGRNEIPRLSEIGMDYRVFLFTLIVSILTGLVFGLAPAIAAAKPDLISALKESSRNATAGRNRLRQTLVIAEVALALVVLVGAGSLVTSFARLLAVKPGFNPEHLLTMRKGASQQYSPSTNRKRFVTELDTRLETLPGVESVGIGDDLPIAGTDSSTSLKIQDQPGLSEGDSASVGLHVINPHYFERSGHDYSKAASHRSRRSRCAICFRRQRNAGPPIWPNEDLLENGSDITAAIPGVKSSASSKMSNIDGLHLPLRRTC